MRNEIFFVSLQVNMKTIIITMLLVLSAQGAVAQQTIEDIRKAYAGVVEYIGMMSDDFPGEGIPPEYYHLHANAAGNGNAQRGHSSVLLRRGRGK